MYILSSCLFFFSLFFAHQGTEGPVLLAHVLVLSGTELIFVKEVPTQCQEASASHTTLPVSRLGVCKMLGGNTAGTADPR